MSQLPLALALHEHARFDTFVVDGNAAAVAHVRALGEGRRSDLLWLWGPPGAGKTHLLQAACRSAGDAGLRSMYVPLVGSPAPDGAPGPELLAGLEALDLLALDDIDAVAGAPDWEPRLFSLLNDYYSSGGRVLLGAQAAPAQTPFALRDLASRACGAIVYRLDELGEDDRLAALIGHAQTRGLELDGPTARFLLSRVDRSMTEVCRWLDLLDRASLAAQRKLTIPFIRDALAERGRD